MRDAHLGFAGRRKVEKWSKIQPLKLKVADTFSFTLHLLRHSKETWSGWLEEGRRSICCGQSEVSHTKSLQHTLPIAVVILMGCQVQASIRSQKGGLPARHGTASVLYRRCAARSACLARLRCASPARPNAKRLPALQA